jgi:hypothetical protein
MRVPEHRCKNVDTNMDTNLPKFPLLEKALFKQLSKQVQDSKKALG